MQEEAEAARHLNNGTEERRIVAVPQDGPADMAEQNVPNHADPQMVCREQGAQSRRGAEENYLDYVLGLRQALAHPSFRPTAFDRQISLDRH